MKCPNCYHNMRYVRGEGAQCYFECPSCGYTIGKPVEKKEEEKKEDKK